VVFKVGGIAQEGQVGKKTKGGNEGEVKQHKGAKMLNH